MDGTGQPALRGAWAFLPSPVAALPPPQEGSPALVFDSL